MIFIIAGKAKAGKDTTAKIIKEYAERHNLSTINLQFSSYIKMYARSISNWDGSEETKPRILLQELGEKIRNNIDIDFFINRIKEDVRVYQDYFDIITISDARFPRELDSIKEAFPESIKLKIIRPNYNPYASEQEKNHQTETALDNYTDVDYTIVNDSDIPGLEVKVNDLLNQLIQ